MSIKLWGLCIEPQYDFDGFRGYATNRQLVATFDTVELAEAYVRASRTWPGPKYRASSLLRNYTSHEIEEPEPEPPHNPTLEKESALPWPVPGHRPWENEK
tara:strand:+ start:1089 stop:1391 length:303 start_codon:yes stop_codon:yes gene_type:complete